MNKVEQEYIYGYDQYLLSKDGKVRKEIYIESKRLWSYYYPKNRVDDLGREYVLLTQENGEATRHYIASLLLETYDEETLTRYLLPRVLKKKLTSESLDRFGSVLAHN